MIALLYLLGHRATFFLIIIKLRTSVATDTGIIISYEKNTLNALRKNRKYFKNINQIKQA